MSNPLHSRDFLNVLPDDPRETFSTKEEEPKVSAEPSPRAQAERMPASFWDVFFDEEPADAAPPAPPPQCELKTPLPVIGRRPPQAPSYTLLKQIGLGGFGEVWEGVQNCLGRVIAIKKLREDVWDRAGNSPGSRLELEVLFRREAITTAQLDHPNIIPIHDMGEDASGRPMLAMKRVRGKPWDEVLQHDFGRVAPEQFLARHLPVLVSVAQAVAFAHSRGIVHRDIKPSQVMLGEFGEVLLMDWGLAMAWTHDNEEHWDEPALGGLALVPGRRSASSPSGTAAFMAPEQTRGSADGVGPWTDIYLLGGSLYYLLTGTCPHNGKTSAEAFTQAATGEVEDPAARRPGRDMPADLVATAMKALSAAAEGRQPSVRDFIDELQDHLSGASKRRHAESLVEGVAGRLDAGAESYSEYADCLSMLENARLLWPANPALEPVWDQTLSGYARSAIRHHDLAMARIQAQRVMAEERRAGLLADIARAEQRRQRVRHQRAAYLTAAVLLLAVVAAGSIKYWHDQRRANERLSDVNVELALQRDRADSSRRRAEDLLNFMLVDLHSGLQPLNRLDLLASVAEKAHEYFEDGAAGPPGEQKARRARVFRNVGEIYAEQGLSEDALGAVEDYLEELRSMPAGESTGLAHQLEVAEAIGWRGMLLDEVGRLEDGIAEVTRGLELRSELAREHPGDARVEASLATAHTTMAGLMQRRGDFSAAEQSLVESLNLRRRLLDAGPRTAKAVLDLAQSWRMLSTVRLSRGDGADAVAAARQSLTLHEEAAALSPDNAVVESYLADAHGTLGATLEKVGQFDEAWEHHGTAHRIFERLSTADPTNSQWTSAIGTTLHQIAAVNEARGDFAAALRNYEEARDWFGRLVRLSPNNSRWRSNYASSLNNLGLILRMQGKPQEALESHQQAVIEFATLLAQEPSNTQVHSNLIQSHLNVGVSHYYMDAPELAAAAYEEALASQNKLLEVDPGNVEWRLSLSTLLNNLGLVSNENGDSEKAEEYFEHAIAIRRELSTQQPDNLNTSIELVRGLLNLSLTQQQAGRAEAALANASEALTICRAVLARDPRYAAAMSAASSILNNVGAMHYGAEDYIAAEDAFQEALGFAEAMAALDASNVETRMRLAVALRNLGLIQYAAEKYPEGLASATRALGITDSVIDAHGEQDPWLAERMSCHYLLADLFTELGEAVKAEESTKLAEGLAERLGVEE